MARKRKTKKGLGDTVAKITEVTGIKKLVGDCEGCNKRQEKLNKLLDSNYEKTVLIDVVSDFQKVGSPQSNKIEQMKYVFPFLGFVFIVLFFLLNKFKSFILTYKEEK